MSSLIVIILVVCVLFYVYIKWKLSYWTRLGVAHLTPDFLIGNLRGYQTKYKVSTLVQNIYTKLKGSTTAPIVGMYMFSAPVAIVTDLDFLKNVFVKDFEYFSDRGLYHNERDDPLSANLVFLPHAQWKPLRAKLSPTFQSARLKAMHPIFQGVAQKFNDYLVDQLISTSMTNFSQLFDQFTTSLILQTVYGCEEMCFGHSNNTVVKMGHAIMNKSKLELVKDLFLIAFPNLSRKLRLKWFSSAEVRNFFINLSRDTIKYREANNISRHDVMGQLMQMRQNDKTPLTDDQVAAQAFIFFFGGYETSSKTLGFVVYELAMNVDIQQKVREEVQRVYESNGNTITYDSLQEMTYLQQVVNETLRKYPIIDSAFRKVERDYPVPNSTVVLRKGQQIVIPIYAIHKDKDIYPDPETFNPDRFTKEEIAKRHQYAHIPFASGPRHCIGARYGQYTVKIALAYLLRQFQVKPCDQTDNPMKFKLNRQILEPLNDIYLKVEPVM